MENIQKHISFKWVYVYRWSRLGILLRTKLRILQRLWIIRGSRLEVLVRVKIRILKRLRNYFLRRGILSKILLGRLFKSNIKFKQIGISLVRLCLGEYRAVVRSTHSSINYALNYAHTDRWFLNILTFFQVFWHFFQYFWFCLL